MERWIVAAKRADFEGIAAEFQIDPVIARVIRNRDVIGAEAIKNYLHGDISQMHSPSLLKDMDKAIAILVPKINEKKKIRIIGDYDIDGVCSTYILLQGLKRVGANADADIPDRIKDGYGISEDLITLAREDKVDTIITCDNGISAGEQIAYAKKSGMTVIVTDHHDVPYEEKSGEDYELLPLADAIINPKQKECGYPFEGLCGAAVALKLVQALFTYYQIPTGELQEYIIFSAIATVGDVMDLVKENRILVKEGLRCLKDTGNIGLQELIKANQLEEKEITAYHIGFILGPCMNASGRLSTAKRALELFACQDRERAASLAGDLKALNDSRKELTAKGILEAIEQVESTSLKDDKILVIYLPDCHESLAGIIAGRVRERYGKPSFVLTRSKEEVKGSGRSIEGYHMFQGLLSCKEMLEKFGGHPMAAGLSIKEEKIDKLRKKLNQECNLTEEDFQTKIKIDVPMPVAYITADLVKQLAYLEPFGKGNTKPVFAQKNLKIMGCHIFGKNRNVVKMKAFDEEGFGMEAIYFGEGDEFVCRIGEKERWSVTYYPVINSYMGRNTLQIVIQNYQ